MRGRIETRIGILEISKTLFFDLGLTRVTMDEIATAVGISKKTLYVNFSSKDQLVEAVLKRQILQVLRQYKDILNSPNCYVVKLRSLLVLVGERISTMGHRFQADLRRLYPLLWHRVEHLRDQTIFESFSLYIDDGIKLGLVRPDVNMEVFLSAYLYALQGMTCAELLRDRSFSSKEVILNVNDVMVRGILTDRGIQEFIQHQSN